MTITYIVGATTIRGNYSKFYVKGLEENAVRVEGGRRDETHRYTACVHDGSPVGTVFTVFLEENLQGDPDKHGFWICETSDENYRTTIISHYGDGICTGTYKVLVAAETRTKARRLKYWWQHRPKNASLKLYAEMCGKHIDVWGRKEIPQVELESVMNPYYYPLN